jgi:hypothetical protein
MFIMSVGRIRHGEETSFSRMLCGFLDDDSSPDFPVEYSLDYRLV